MKTWYQKKTLSFPLICNVFSRRLAMLVLSVLCLCALPACMSRKPPAMTASGEPSLAGTWSGKTDKGHRLTIFVDESDAGYRLAEVPLWDIRRDWLERLFIAWIGSKITLNFSGWPFIPPATKLDEIDQDALRAKLAAEEKARNTWLANRRILIYKVSEVDADLDKSFEFATDFENINYYEFHFESSGKVMVTLDKSYRFKLKRKKE